jgi:GH15 family glucan-1,4-alpha-glucosidase
LIGAVRCDGTGDHGGDGSAALPKSIHSTLATSGDVHEGSTRSAHPPIADYAFLSDCESNCLIAPSGAVEWMCLPRHDSPSVFGAILDRAAGSFGLGPHGVQVPAARRYLPGSLMLETTWKSPTGWLIVRDTLLMGPWHNISERSFTHGRTPTDYDAEHCLLRTVKCVSGAVDLSMVCEPMFGYGRREASWRYDGPGYGEAVASHPDLDHDVTPKLTTDLRLGLEGRMAQARTRMSQGDTAFVALCGRDWRRPGPGWRPRGGWDERPSAGGNGSMSGRFRITHGAAIWYAARSL